MSAEERYQIRRLAEAVEKLLAYVQQVHEEAQEAGDPGIDWSHAEELRSEATAAVQRASSGRVPWAPR